MEEVDTDGVYDQVFSRGAACPPEQARKMAQPDRQRSLTGFFNASTSSCISSLVFDGHLPAVPHYQATASDLDKAFRWLSRLALPYRRCCYVALPSTIHILSTRPNLQLQSHTYAGTVQYLCTSSSDRSILPTATESVSVAVMTIPGAVSASVHPLFAYFASSRSAISYDVSSLLPYKGLLLLLRCVGFCSSIGCFLFSDMVAQGMLTNCSIKMTNQLNFISYRCVTEY